MGQTPASDSMGKVIFKKNTGVRFYLGTKRDGSNALPLQVNSKYTVKLSTAGKYTMTHLDLKLHHNVPFEIYADGKAPESTYELSNGEKGSSKFWYAKSPCYISFSASDDLAGVEAIFISIDGDPFFEYTDTVALEKEKKYDIKFFSVDKVNNRGSVSSIQILVDGTPPVTELETEGDRYENTVSGRSIIKLKASDANGVRKVVYQLDGGKEYSYSMPIKTATIAEGDHTMVFYAEDMAGNMEVPQTFSFFVDKTPPLVFEEITGNSYLLNGRSYSSGRSQLRISAVDNKAGVKNIYYTINGKTTFDYDKPVYLSDLIGTVSIKSFAVDNVNNRSSDNQESQQMTVPAIDIAGPRVGHRFVGNMFMRGDTTFIAPTTRVKIDAIDPESGVAQVTYRLDSAVEAVYSEPFTVAKEGSYHLAYTAFDNVDNINIGKGSFFVDATGPVVSIIFGANPISTDATGAKVYPSNLIVFLGATDQIAGVSKIFYSLNGEKDHPYIQPISNFKSGKIYTLKVKAFDALGNMSEKEITFKIGE
jgi:hypothetical protein